MWFRNKKHFISLLAAATLHYKIYSIQTLFLAQTIQFSSRKTDFDLKKEELIKLLLNCKYKLNR